MAGDSGIALLGLALLYMLSKKNGAGGFSLVDRTSSWFYYYGNGNGEETPQEAEELPIVITGPRHRIKPVDPASRARAYAEAYPGGPMFGFDEPAKIIPVIRKRHRILPVVPIERARAYAEAYGPMKGFDE